MIDLRRPHSHEARTAAWVSDVRGVDEHRCARGAAGVVHRDPLRLEVVLVALAPCDDPFGDQLGDSPTDGMTSAELDQVRVGWVWVRESPTWLGRRVGKKPGALRGTLSALGADPLILEVGHRERLRAV